MSTHFIADCEEVDKSTAHIILTKVLLLGSISGVKVPHTLSEENRAAMVDSFRKIQEGVIPRSMERFCNKLVVQDDSCVYLLGSPPSNRTTAGLHLVSHKQG